MKHQYQRVWEHSGLVPLAGFSASAGAMERIAAGGIGYALADAPSRLLFLEVRDFCCSSQTSSWSDGKAHGPSVRNLPVQITAR
jgi:hypothetical protein